MKTTVMGIFEVLDDAENVLAKLIESPLDVSALQVLNRNAKLQRRLDSRAELRNQRPIEQGAVIGALIGLLIGLALSVEIDGQPAFISGPGPMLSMASGALIGLLIGLAYVLLSDALDIPVQHEPEIMNAIQSGATMITVRTNSVPTANAVDTFFRESGSLIFEAGPQAGEHENEHTGDHGSSRLASDDSIFAPTEDSEAASIPVDESNFPDEHRPFAPPWRREDDEASPSLAGSKPQASGMLFPESSTLNEVTPKTTTSPSSTSDDSTFRKPSRTRKNLSTGAPKQPKIRYGDSIFSVDDRTQAVEQRSVEPIGLTASSAPDTRPLSVLGLSPRVYATLIKAGVASVNDLQHVARAGDTALLDIHGIGQSALDEIRQRLVDHGPKRRSSIKTPSTISTEKSKNRYTPQVPAIKSPFQDSDASASQSNKTRSKSDQIPTPAESPSKKTSSLGSDQVSAPRTSSRPPESPKKQNLSSPASSATESRKIENAAQDIIKKLFGDDGLE